jgi:uncharacterized protein
LSVWCVLARLSRPPPSPTRTYYGLTRRHRDGDLATARFARGCEQFERDWTGYLKIHPNEDVLGTARLVIQRHILRGFNGIHLASALTLQHGWGETVVVAAADQRLLRAAADEGLATLNVETGESTPSPHHR